MSHLFASLRTKLPLFACLFLLAVTISGCSRMQHMGHETVYVFAQQTSLRDRVAAVSNIVGKVSNGQHLEVLEHGRRFLKVKTEKNEIGWIEEHAVITQKTYDAFTALADQHKNDNVIATAVVRDDVFLHLAPGRNTDRYYLLPANSKVQLLVRASVPKVTPGMAPVVARPAAPAKFTASSTAKTVAAPTAPAPAPPVMEDWWLIRDQQGRAGWLLAGRVDVDAPDDIAQYAEGARIIGAYVLNKVTDEDVDQNGQTVTQQKSQYVTVLEPMKSGQPYDFDQLRVFTWNPRRHRYETAFRMRSIAGFLPVTVTQVPGGPNGAMVPQFSFLLGALDHLKIDPDTGITRPVSPRTISYQLIETTVKRVGPDMDPIPSLNPEEDKKKEEAKQARLAARAKVQAKRRK